MGILEDFQRNASNLARDVGDGVSDLGRNAQSAIDQATRNTAALAGSGVNRAGRITGPLADMFGSDPHAFILNVSKKMRTQVRTLCIRTAERTGKADYIVQTQQGRRKVTARPSNKASANQIALTLALATIDAPATANEEAGRISRGLPVKARGLDGGGFSVFPTALPAAAFAADDGDAQERGFIEGIPLPTPTDLALLLPIILPIVAAIAVAVLPGLISAAAGVLQSVTSGGKPSPEQEQAALDEKAKEEESNTIMMIVVGAVVLLLGGGVVYALTRKRKAAA